MLLKEYRICMPLTVDEGASALYPGSPKSLENLLAYISENRFGIRVVLSLE